MPPCSDTVTKKLFQILHNSRNLNEKYNIVLEYLKQFLNYSIKACVSLPQICSVNARFGRFYCLNYVCPMRDILIIIFSYSLIET